MYSITEKNINNLANLSQIKCTGIGCALTFASEAKFEIEAKISFRLEAKKKPDFSWFTSMWNTKNLKRKRR